MPKNASRPILPLKNLVIFPNLVASVAVGRAMSIAAVRAAMDSNNEIITVLQHDAKKDDITLSEVNPIGTLCTIQRVEKRDGGAQVVLHGEKRVRLFDFEDVEPVEDEGAKYFECAYKTLVDLHDTPIDETTEAMFRENLEIARKVANILNPERGDQIFRQTVGSQRNHVTQTYRIVSNSSLVGYKEAQEILEIEDVLKLMERVHEILNHEQSVLKLQREIQSSAREANDQLQREAMLRQQKKVIEEALGENEAEDEIAELKEKLRNVNFPDATRKEIDRELRRLQKMSPAAAEFQVSRSYMELITELPWNVITEDNLDLAHAKQVLDEDHFGLDDIKDRILEALAVLQLNPEAKASILCFVGPPGVGKTSLGQSIARAMGRKFERMSLGGLHDEGELRGHRRTYIGAMPGRIIQSVRRCGVRNPVLMLDELDKLGRDFRGDPSSALMEILDPEQNKEFRDNYLNLPFDLSKVLFIATGNTLDGIPRPLLDRMEVLELTGYSEFEKVEIARRYLIPRQIENTGLDDQQLQITDDGIAHAIRRYTREAGVRELERTIERAARKRAKESLMSKKLSEYVDADTLVELLGPERFKSDQGRGKLSHGVATGLAWTEAGGDVLYIEASLTHKDEKVTITGHVGQVMQESVKAARSYIWAAAEDLHIDRDAIEHTGVHIHVPAGAVPKDGPSAGITMATALASAYSQKVVRDDVAMTGELTLTGLVLPVGGIREKILAAHRTGIRHVIMPKENEPELQKLPEPVRGEMQFSLVENLRDVVEIAIPDLKPKHPRRRKTTKKINEA